MLIPRNLRECYFCDVYNGYLFSSGAMCTRWFIGVAFDVAPMVNVDLASITGPFVDTGKIFDVFLYMYVLVTSVFLLVSFSRITGQNCQRLEVRPEDGDRLHPEVSPCKISFPSFFFPLFPVFMKLSCADFCR